MEFAAGFFLGAFLLYVWQERKYKLEIKKNQEQHEEDLDNEKNSLGEHGKLLLETSKSDFADRLREELSGFQQGVLKDLKKDLIEQKQETARLNNQLDFQKENLEKLTDSAETLREAMGGNPRVSGETGEWQLESLLENNGLIRNENYEVQESIGSGRPDIVVKLDNKRKIIIDSKFITKKYLEYVESGDKADLNEHIQKLKNTVRDLSKRVYQKKSKNSYDHVVMYIPINDALLSVVKHDKDFLSYAKNQKVLVVCPILLMPYINTIARFWQSEKREKNHEKLVELVTTMYEKYAGVTDNIQTVKNAFDKLDKKLTGRGGFSRQLERAKDLGISPKNQIKERSLEEE